MPVIQESPFFIMLASIFALFSALVPVATVAVATVGIWSAIQQSKQQKKALKASEKLAAEQLAAQGQYAGEYLELTERQMELQSQQREIETLAGLIQSREVDRQVYTLPAAKTYTPIEQINMAIDKLIRG